MGITLNIFKGGRIQSLGFKNVNGKDVTMGVIMPGEYDLGIAKRDEELTIVEGILAAKGNSFLPMPGEEPVVFKKGERIQFSCISPVAYICRFGPK